MKEFLLIVVIVVLMNTKKQISKVHYLSLGMLMTYFKKDKSSRWIRMNY